MINLPGEGSLGFLRNISGEISILPSRKRDSNYLLSEAGSPHRFQQIPILKAALTR